MENKPLVSVCMISYNHQAFISRAIEGVLMQETNFPIELVIGEDCSTDGTREICLEYQHKHPNIIRVLPRNKNLGMMPNFIDTLENSKEKYIALCEGDDYWTDPLKLQKQVSFLEENPDFAICFHRVKMVFEEESDEILSNENQKEISEFEDLALENYIHTPSCVFRNGLFEKFPDWFYQSPVGDWVLHLLNAQHGKIKFLEDVMAVYRIHNNGVWSMKDPIEIYIKWIGVVEKCCQYFYPKASNIFMQNIANKYEKMSFSYFHTNDFKNFRKCYRHYLKIGKNADVRTTLALKLRYLLSFFPSAVIRYKKLFNN
jgi:glycosyltransferase involved in cell wall biosynthesis